MSLSLSSAKVASSDTAAVIVAGALSGMSMEVSAHGFVEASLKSKCHESKRLSSRYSSVATIFNVSHNYSRTGFYMACLASTESNEVLRSEYAHRAALCGVVGSLCTAYGQDVLRRVKKMDAGMCKE